MRKKACKILILSPSFYGGGAEQILSQLYNYDPESYDCACFEYCQFNSYLLNDPPKCNCLSFFHHRKESTEPKYKNSNLKAFLRKKFPDISKKTDSLIQVCIRINFLRKLVSKYSSVILSDYSTLYLLLISLSLFRGNIYIVFRPSIDLYYVKNIFFAGSIFYKVLNTLGLVLLKSHKTKSFIFQTQKIRKSFQEYPILSNCDKYLVLNNPLSPDRAFPEHVNMYSEHSALNFTYIGRATFDKGFDRYVALSQGKSIFNHNFYYHGPTELHDWDCKNIIDCGWSNPSNILYKNHILIIPSRVEGYPNVLVEALSSGILVFCSIEVYSLLEQYARHLLPYVHLLRRYDDYPISFFYDYILRLDKNLVQKQICTIKNLHSIQKYSISIKDMLSNS